MPCLALLWVDGLASSLQLRFFSLQHYTAAERESWREPGRRDSAVWEDSAVETTAASSCSVLALVTASWCRALVRRAAASSCCQLPARVLHALCREACCCRVAPQPSPRRPCLRGRMYTLVSHMAYCCLSVCLSPALPTYHHSRTHTGPAAAKHLHALQHLLLAAAASARVGLNSGSQAACHTASAIAA